MESSSCCWRNLRSWRLDMVAVSAPLQGQMGRDYLQIDQKLSS
jgi:hypothetical protein